MAAPRSNSWPRTSVSVWSAVHMRGTSRGGNTKPTCNDCSTMRRLTGNDRRQSPPREGRALLQGLLLCGRCGDRISVRYSVRADGQQVPLYLCDRTRVGARTCQSIPGASPDEAISALLVELVKPLTLEVAIQSHLAEASRPKGRGAVNGGGGRLTELAH